MHVARWVWLRDLVNIEFNICGTINHSQITLGRDMQTPNRLCLSETSLKCFHWCVCYEKNNINQTVANLTSALHILPYGLEAPLRNVIKHVAN